jgi:hypothetical protein
MDKQADIAASQTRAFVYVDKLATTIDANGNFIGDIEWGNSGNTPTKELTVRPASPTACTMELGVLQSARLVSAILQTRSLEP